MINETILNVLVFMQVIDLSLKTWNYDSSLTFL